MRGGIPIKKKCDYKGCKEKPYAALRFKIDEEREARLARTYPNHREQSWAHYCREHFQEVIRMFYTKDHRFYATPKRKQKSKRPMALSDMREKE